MRQLKRLNRVLADLKAALRGYWARKVISDQDQHAKEQAELDKVMKVTENIVEQSKPH